MHKAQGASSLGLVAYSKKSSEKKYKRQSEVWVTGLYTQLKYNSKWLENFPADAKKNEENHDLPKTLVFQPFLISYHVKGGAYSKDATFVSYTTLDSHTGLWVSPFHQLLGVLPSIYPHQHLAILAILMPGTKVTVLTMIITLIYLWGKLMYFW